MDDIKADMAQHLPWLTQIKVWYLLTPTQFTGVITRTCGQHCFKA